MSRLIHTPPPPIWCGGVVVCCPVKPSDPPTRPCGREKLAGVHPVLAINKVRGRWPVALKAAIAVADYRPMVADIAALGYAVLGACWHPEAGLARAGAARASSVLEAITRHPVSQHRSADELAEDVAVVRAELQRWS